MNCTRKRTQRVQLRYQMPCTCRYEVELGGTTFDMPGTVLAAGCTLVWYCAEHATVLCGTCHMSHQSSRPSRTPHVWHDRQGCTTPLLALRREGWPGLQIARPAGCVAVSCRHTDDWMLTGHRTTATTATTSISSCSSVAELRWSCQQRMQTLATQCT
jgi:hypothetical protein